ncbi:hypothetical protein PYW08_010398 [Mythimna loreyi]|uniref:Uncharacterized protein n=1 Tax=Mythimna loreyi TaxID=667449 RepID=A0ACC2Q4P6_9NEOP|nr:hypothetical protein PYW08_010398 [Mythimna loreyi]
MYKFLIVLQLFVLYVGISQSWDIAVTHEKLLEFYTNEVKTKTIAFNTYPRSIAYNEVHEMILYVDKETNNDAICGYSIPFNTCQFFLDRNGRNIHGLAFDPITEFVFFTDVNERSINWITLEPESSKNANLLIKLDDGIPTDIAVDSCNGYVYWITTNLPTPKLERIRYNGSGREVILDLNALYTNSYYKLEPHSLAIDQITRKIYWMEPRNTSMYTIYYADLNGDNKIATTVINLFNYKFTNPTTNTLAVSASALFMSTWCSDCDRTILKLAKTEYTGESYIPMHVTNQIFSLVAKNKIRIHYIRYCEALHCTEPYNAADPYCVHGEKVFMQCLCKCKPGYIGKRCDVSVCSSYCFHGRCSVNDDGVPKCR